MSGSFVMCKINDRVKRRSRHMQVVVSSEVKSKNVVLMNSVAWYNLGGKLFVDVEDRRVTVKVGGNYDQLVFRSNLSCCSVTTSYYLILISVFMQQKL